jgi:FAD/FMN-containing dehydrogenase
VVSPSLPLKGARASGKGTVAFRPDYQFLRLIAEGEDVGRERRLEHLRALRLTGDVVSETEPGWDLARQAWNLAADQRPPHVAFPETTEDIVKLVTFAGQHGLRVVPQGTGHGAWPLGAIEDSVLLRPARLRDVEIDPVRRRARIGAGVTWGQVQAAAAPHGLAGLEGSSPEVGVVGYTLGGGLGWLARRYGLACNSVLAVEVVTADGRLLRVDREHEPDLFWALRGGGGSFGVVTALEFALYPVRELYAGALFWPQERAAEILQAWQAWTAGVPDSVTSVGRILNLPTTRAIPKDLRGRSFVLVEAACLATGDEGTELLRPLRELGPEIDTFAMLPPTGLGAVHMDPVDPVPAFVDGWLLADLPSAAIDALVEAAGAGSGSPLLSVELRHLGGALADAAADHGALASLDAKFLTATISLVPNANMAAAVERHAAIVRASLAPWEAERNYPNFAERSFQGPAFHSPPTLKRLGRVKAQYDPRDLIRSTHPIASA